MAAFDYIYEKTDTFFSVKIPKKDLIEGVLDIVLFNETEKPVAERLVFIKKENTISVSVKKTNGTETSIRDRVNLEVAVKNTNGKLLASTLSLSITDANLIKRDSNAENIKTYLLLNSDLRGEIKSPNYFFEGKNTVRKSYLLDLIMLTHGWRRFTWQEFIKENPVQAYKPEDGIYISGYTKNNKSPYQTKICETKLTFRTTGFYQETATTNKNGYFSYGPYVFEDDVNVFLQAGENISTEKPNFNETNIVLNEEKEQPSIISERIINSFDQNITGLKSYKAKSRNNVIHNFSYDQDRELLGEVTLQTKVATKEELADIERNKRTRFFEPSHRIVVDEMGTHGAGDFMELIANIPGIRVGRKYGENNAAVMDVFITLRGLDPAYYLDDTKINLITALAIQQVEIDFIDIRNTGQASAAYGLEAQGVIAIYTKRGKRGGNKITEKKPGSINFTINGFYKTREFYAPDYSLVDRNRTKIDKRTTLYWNPKIVTRGYSNPNLTFYSSDETGTYQIEIEGVTDLGIPFHSTSYLKVD